MSLQRRLKKTNEKYGKELFMLVGNYIAESNDKPKTQRKEIYYNYRSKWYTLCENNKEVGITLKKESFKEMIDRNYLVLYMKLFPNTPILKRLILKLKTFSYA